MNGVEPAHHVLQPFQVRPTTPDRRRKHQESQAFELALVEGDGATDHRENEALRKEASSRGYEGLGENVDVVA